MSKFAYLKPKTPIGQVVVDYTIWDLEGEPVLHVRTAADPNHDYRNAVTAAHGRSRRRVRGNRRDDVGAVEKLQYEIDMDLYPKFIVTGWRGVNDEHGDPVEFTEDNCRDFLKVLDEVGLFILLRAFCIDVTNFSDVFCDTEEVVGNSPPASPGS